MSRPVVAVLRTRPETVPEDYHTPMNLAGYQDVVAKDADTALKINISERRHWTHPVIHETLVDLLMIQQKVHRGVFAVMDGTFAGDGPGPRCMIPQVKNVILASADQVAIDAVAARLMGMDPLSIKFIRLAHDLGLGCGDPREIEIAGDASAAGENWHFVGPFRKMTFASRRLELLRALPSLRPLC